MLRVYSVNIKTSEAILTDGQILPVTTWIGREGEETEDPGLALCCVAGPDKKGRWWAIDLQYYKDERTLH